MILRLLSALALLLSPLGSTAADWIELRFGPEFTFANRYGRYSDRDEMRLKRNLERHLIGGQQTGSEFNYRVDGDRPVMVSPNGWSFDVIRDVTVAEFRMAPMTLKDFKRFKSDIQDAIFISAANVGLFPWAFLGGGHISVGVDEFTSNPLLTYNFIVDFFNHNELALGVLGFDSNNATPLSMASESIRNSVKEVLDSFALRLRNDPGSATSNELFRLLANAYRKDERYSSVWRVAPYSKHVDLSAYDWMGNHHHNGRLEIRCVRPQRDIETWINQIELLQARLNLLKRRRTPLGFKPKVPIAEPLKLSFADDGHLLNPPVDPQLALASFYTYVTESGLKWDDHRSYIWPAWITSGELSKFEEGDFFKARNSNAPSSCATALL